MYQITMTAAEKLVFVDFPAEAVYFRKSGGVLLCENVNVLFTKKCVFLANMSFPFSLLAIFIGKAIFVFNTASPKGSID